MNRRELFRLGRTGLLSALVTSGYFNAIAGRSQAAPSADKVLVWLELRGGNDGLNTVIPYRDTLYLQARPGLAITEGPSLNRDLILHPALAPLHPIWQARRLALALGVGWPQPNRSHFRAMDQWSTASMAGDGPGWLAIATDRRRSPGPLVALDPSGSRALDGGKALSVQLSPSQLAAAPGLDLDPAGPAVMGCCGGFLSWRPTVTRCLHACGRVWRPSPRASTSHVPPSVNRCPSPCVSSVRAPLLR